MEINTVIFDMDGLLVDTEPLWKAAADEVFAAYGKKVSLAEYLTTTGLRTREFVNWWLRDYEFDNTELEKAGNNIVNLVIKKFKRNGTAMPGVEYIFDFFASRKFKIGLATSSPLTLANEVASMLGIEKYLEVITSAENLNYGKPHPQVYIDCADQLGVSPLQCVAFEDSINGMLSAKSARMKCVIVPAHDQAKDDRWSLADLKLSSLQNFSDLHLNLL
jgi:mannitol-1-/sugar-/sorbitol-6-/2-deoxyglucose-6-phosphatase